MSLVNGKKRFFLVFGWIAANLMGVSIAMLVVFYLYVQFEINRYSYAKDWLQLIKGIAICGVAQGLILSSFQSIVLFLAKVPVIKWLLANIFGMSLGIVLPILYGVAIANSTNEYIIPALILSWIMAGVLSAIATVKHKKQRLLTAINNSIAYLCWGLALIISWLFLAAYFDNPEIETLIIGGCFSLLMFAVGAWLSSYVFFNLCTLGKPPIKRT